jgi:hypothetical protein
MTTKVRHKARGTLYEVVGDAEAQISVGVMSNRAPNLGRKSRPLYEGDQLTVYRCLETNKLWIRFPDEMLDGRFEVVGT